MQTGRRTGETQGLFFTAHFQAPRPLLHPAVPRQPLASTQGKGTFVPLPRVMPSAPMGLLGSASTIQPKQGCVAWEGALDSVADSRPYLPDPLSGPLSHQFCPPPAFPFPEKLPCQAVEKYTANCSCFLQHFSGTQYRQYEHNTYAGEYRISAPPQVAWKKQQKTVARLSFQAQSCHRFQFVYTILC